MECCCEKRAPCVSRNKTPLGERLRRERARRIQTHARKQGKDLMNPEALIGLALGKSVLQRLLGQGTMGAVYLASQTGRQVAVKVFLPAATLEQADQENFQKRLEEVITWGASLDHPSILRILEHGKQGGLIYQVTPYIAGEDRK